MTDHAKCLAELQRMDVQVLTLRREATSAAARETALRAELTEARKWAAQMRGALELTEQALRENADAERPEIAAVLDVSAKARAGVLLP